MEKLIMLGTGNAAVTKCYNTCFALKKEKEYFLIDTGGGNGILSQLEKAEISITDIHSSKAKQFGFSIRMKNEKRFTFLGDEPYRESEIQYVKNAEWVMHEAFCRYEDREIFEPYEKHHATVKDACEMGEKLKVKNLVLYHTEDKNIEERKVLYGNEGKEYYNGQLWIPDDLEEIRLEVG